MRFIYLGCMLPVGPSSSLLCLYVYDLLWDPLLYF
jgi:hypothetical protein